MKILHYSLGLPPYRSGGLTKYSSDLMIEQVKQGDSVYLLFPGEFRLIKDKVEIKKYRIYNGIKVYKLLNPLPVPLLKGISSPKNFMKKCDKSIFISFLKKINIDIVHIHTFMGLYKEFLEACKDLNIKIVYTTHDYFGLCTKVNFIDNKGKLCEERDIEKCLVCNSFGYKLNNIKILQSKSYRFAKNKGLIDKIKNTLFLLKKKKEFNFMNGKTSDRTLYKYLDSEEYIKLIKYYNDMYKSIDKFLFNSRLTMQIYNTYFKAKGEIISITHENIKDNRSIKSYSGNKLKLTYLGPFKEYKGFFLMVDVMKELELEGYNNIELNAYGDSTNLSLKLKNINVHGKYLYSELKNIFDNTDILIVPSIWNETFGFITIEALSYGVPVLITDKVGSQDLLYSNNGKEKGIIVSPSKNKIKEEIINLYKNPEILIQLNLNILDDKFNYLLSEHYKVINNSYKKLIGANK
ncbi:glycosyltransferase [Clostridium perfringens]|uniref:glycosyltransferase n=1 Tax=Clostridium perfringens TaxID=1502 RepID=UPI0039E83139